MVDHAPIGAMRESSGDREARFAASLADAERPGCQKSTAVYERLPGVDLRARPPRVSGAAPRFLARVTLGILLAALPAHASDGGVWDSPLYDQCPDAPPPEAVEVRGSFFEPVAVPDGGTSWLLPPERAARVACLMKTCETRRTQLEEGDTAPMVLVMTLAIGMGVGLATGALLVWQLKR